MDRISSDPFAAADDVDGSRDGRGRNSLALIASLRFVGDDRVREVRVRNLSAGGLMAECARVEEPGTPVSLDLRGIGQVTGKVAWCTEGRIGIALDSPIDPAKANAPFDGGAEA